MNHTPNTEQRAEFEEWARPFYILDRTSEDKYEYQGAYIAWFAWQAARATQAAPASPNTGAVKDHNVRQLVNDLREIALKFHATGQLRERISGAVHQFLAPIRATPSPSKGGEAGAAKDNSGKEA